MYWKIEEGKFGKKVVATRSIKTGETICSFTGVAIDYQKTLTLGNKESFAFQTGANLYILLDEPGRYFNHSCDPNCGVTPDKKLIALQDIMPNEELCWDYSTSMLEHHWTMECKCGTKLCRKVIRDFDTLPLCIQQKYIRLNVVQGFITDILKARHSFIQSH